MLVIEAYQSTCAGLVTFDRDVSTSAMNAARGCSRASQGVHRAAVHVLAAWTPKGAALSQIVALQRMAAEFERMGTRVGRIAEASLRLPSSAEHLIAPARPDAPDLLVRLMRHVYVMLRASLLIAARQDKAVAMHVMSEYGEVVRVRDRLRQVVAAAPAATPHLVSAMIPLGGLIEDLAALAESAVIIARGCMQPG
jgi:phosphate uptake regulator